MGFVTKAPSNFNGLVKDDIVRSAVVGIMDRSPKHAERYLYDTESEYGNGKLRFIAYRLPGGTELSEEYLMTAGFEHAEKKIARFKSGKYFCEDDAKKAFDDMMAEYNGMYPVDIEFKEDARLVKKDPDGPHWRGRPGNITIDRTSVRTAAERYSVRVLVTNLPFATEDDNDLRKGATADTVVDIYLGQYYSEKNFRIMKSGMGVNHVYIHTHSRQDAMVFVASLATSISNTIDAVLAENGSGLTFRQSMYRFKNCIIEYDRVGDSMIFKGPAELRSEFYGLMGMLKTDRRFLLGF